MTFARGAKTQGGTGLPVNRSQPSKPATAGQDPMREVSTLLMPNNKRTDEEHDTYAMVTLGGMQYRIRAWHRTDSAGRTFIKLTFLPRGPA
jgi:hypothetical protein